jgi:hypothetical protein
MSYKKFVLSSILLLVLATGTAWGNAPTVSALRIPPEQPALALSGSVRFSPLLANNNSPHPPFVRTGIFGDAAEKVTVKRPVVQVQTGVFWGPQGFRDKGHGYSLSNVPKLGLFELPDGIGVEDRTGQRHEFQIIQRRNP